METAPCSAAAAAAAAAPAMLVDGVHPLHASALDGDLEEVKALVAKLSKQSLGWKNHCHAHKDLAAAFGTASARDIGHAAATAAEPVVAPLPTSTTPGVNPLHESALNGALGAVQALVKAHGATCLEDKNLCHAHRDLAAQFGDAASLPTSTTPGVNPLHESALNGALGAVQALVTAHGATCLEDKNLCHAHRDLAAQFGDAAALPGATSPVTPTPAVEPLHESALSGALGAVKAVVGAQGPACLDKTNHCHAHRELAAEFGDTVGALPVSTTAGVNPLHESALNGALGAVKAVVAAKGSACLSTTNLCHAHRDLDSNMGSGAAKVPSMLDSALGAKLAALQAALSDATTTTTTTTSTTSPGAVGAGAGAGAGARDGDTGEAASTAASLSKRLGCSVATAKLLMQLSDLDLSVDMRVFSKAGGPAHQSAAYNGHITTLSYMVEQGADVNAVTEDGVSSLHFAALHKQGATVDWLLAHGAKPDVVTKGGVTPAHYALYAGDAVLAAKVHALAKSST